MSAEVAPERVAALLAVLEVARDVLSPEQYTELREGIRELAVLAAALKVSEDTNRELNLKIQDLRRRKRHHPSEKLTPAKREQLGLPAAPKAPDAPDAGQPAPAMSPDAAHCVPPAKEPKKGGGRGPLPKNLPVRIQVIDVPEAQRADLVVIRTEVTDQIGYDPGHHYVLRTVRPVWGSPQRVQPPIVAPLPPQVIPKARVTTSFIVHVIIRKYLDALPLYRQEGIDARAGVRIGRNARCRYVEASATLLLTIYEQLEQVILADSYIHIDEAFTKLLDHERKGKARDAYVWGFYAPYSQAIVMRFSISRSGEILLDFFPENWSGVVHTDGAGMYPSAFKDRPGIVHVECVNHLRRYVLEALEAGQKEAAPLLQDISELYQIETEAAERGLTPAQRGLLRHAKAKPMLKRLQRKFRELEQRKEPLLGKLRTAVNYATSRWRHLATYAKVGHGYVNIDQNPIERQWRSQKVGLRNYLFIGHPDAGWRSAVIYSIVSTCRLVGVDPEEYLCWVLPKLAAATTKTATGLLPHDFKRLKMAQALAASQRPQRSRPPCNPRPPSRRRHRKSHRPRDGSALAA